MHFMQYHYHLQYSVNHTGSMKNHVAQSVIVAPIGQAVSATVVCLNSETIVVVVVIILRHPQN